MGNNVLNSVDALDFRLDLLRLTFTIEETLENIIKGLLQTQRISEEVFKNEWCVNDQLYEEYKGWYNNHEETKKKIWLKQKDGTYKISVKNLIDTNTFGGLIKLIKILKHDKTKGSLLNGAFGDISKRKTLISWLKYVKDARNTLAHKTSIQPHKFFSSLPMPMQSAELSTNKFNSIELRKFVFLTLIPENKRTDAIHEIFDKYEF